MFEKLENNFTGESLGFADDLVLIIENVEEIKPTIKKAILEFEKLGLKLNLKKCAIVEWWKSKKGLKNEVEQKEPIEGIEFKKFYKYLGIEMSKPDEIKEYIKRVDRKAWLLRSRFSKTIEKGSMKLRIMLFKVFLEP